MTTVEQGLTGRALGDAVIDHVLTFPEQHDQEDFACGTQACIAGWAVLLHLGKRDAAGYYDAFLSDGPFAKYTYERAAAELLGVDRREFHSAVVYTADHDEAISNFKHLLDETYSERAS